MKFLRQFSPSADSSRTVVSYWRKDVHQVLVNRLGPSLPRKRAVRLTDRLDMITVVDWDVKLLPNVKRPSPYDHSC